MDKKHCIGCNDDFYNGKNPYGVEACWLLRDAALVKRRRVGISERPPWEREPELLPKCYKEKGFVFVGPGPGGW